METASDRPAQAGNVTKSALVALMRQAAGEEMGMSELEAKLERMVDDGTLREVLRALVAVCDAKSDRILMNWDDPEQARRWMRAARAIDAAILHLPDVPGISS